MTVKGVVIVAPTIVRFTMQHLLNGTTAADVIVDLSVDAGPTGTRSSAVNDVIGHVSHWWQSHVIVNTWNNITYLGAHWIDIDSTGGATGTIGPSGSDPVTSTNTAPMTTPQVCFLIHKNSIAARGLRQGRLYWPNVGEADVDAKGNLTAPVIASQSGAFEGFRSTVGAYNNPPVVASVAWRTVHVHKPDKTDAGTWTWSSSTIDSCVCDPRVATNRRRYRR